MFAIAAAQIEPFATQYSLRTQALFTQAQAHLKDVQTGVRYQTMAPNVRTELEAQAAAALNTSQQTHAAVAEAFPLTKIFALWRKGDEAVLNTTWQSFIPALPLTWSSIFVTVIGAILGFALYELVKFPLAALLRAPPRRRFKKR